MKKIYILKLVIFLIFKIGFSQNKITQMHGKRVLVVYGGWEGHKPKFFAEKFSKWLKSQNATVFISDSTSIYTNSNLMKDLDLIIHHITDGKITKKQSSSLINTIRNGAGLVGCHGGLVDSFRENLNYQYMVGGQFVKHPGDQINYEVKIGPEKDPITNGINDFSVKTEQYYMHIDPDIKILATTEFSGKHDPWIEGAIMPVVWKKAFGRGRVFFNAIGHSTNDYEIPEVWEIIKRGVSWAAQKK